MTLALVKGSICSRLLCQDNAIFLRIQDGRQLPLWSIAFELPFKPRVVEAYADNTFAEIKAKLTEQGIGVDLKELNFIIGGKRVADDMSWRPEVDDGQCCVSQRSFRWRRHLSGNLLGTYPPL